METPIAIVGMSCRFAGSPSPAALWRNIMRRRPLLTPLGVDAALPVGSHNLFARPYPAVGGVLGDLYACVAADQDFPRQMNAGENQDLYFATQLAFDALADAALRPHANPPVRGSVHLGYAPPFNSSTVNWLEHTFFIDQTMEIIQKFFPSAPAESLDAVRGRLVDSLPPPDAASFLTGAGHRVAAWIGHECGFDGPAAVLDAGTLCAPLAAQAAMDALRAGRVDVALVGAVSPPLSRAFLEGLSGDIAFSPTGALRPFDRDADGTLPGEGGAFFVLKRRADALRAHDRIYALLRSVVLGAPAAPSAAALAGLLQSAADAAEIPVKSIQFVEANGDGIADDDAREVAALQSLWGDHEPGHSLVGVGSVKGTIGHALRAAGAAACAKAALALHHRVLAPQVPVDHPLAALANVKSSVYLIDEARPWITGDASSPRRAAVLAQDFDGRAAAVILEEEPEDRS